MEDIPNHYKNYYVSYKKIKKNIIRMSKIHKKRLEKDLIQNAAKKVDKQSMGMLPPFLFNDIIRQEIKKINTFSEIKYNEIINHLVNIYEILKYMEYNNYSLGKENVEKHLDLIGCDIIHFDFYIRKNSKIIMKLGFFFDKAMNISINQWLLLSLRNEYFCNINIDNLIVYLSYLYSLFRSLNENVNKIDKMKNKKSKWVPPDSFERTSTKFLVKYDHIVYTKVKIVKYLPYLIFDFTNEDFENHFKYFIKNKKYITINKNQDSLSTDSIKKLNESQQITSVYFDNRQTTCYINRLLRYENAQLIRFRWYNDNNSEPNKTIFIERKIHHEEWTGEFSTKERFELNQKYVMKYMTGKLNVQIFFLKRLYKKIKELIVKRNVKHKLKKIMEDLKSKKYIIKNNELNEEVYKDLNEKYDIDINEFLSLKEKTFKHMQLAKDIQKKILKEKLKPVVRTSYLRAAFQLSDNNKIRISIDTNISMLNESVKNRTNWCRLAEEALGKNEVIRLNYGIIEVKLKIEEMPLWIKNILIKNKSINVYKYSKCQTAMALLHSKKIKYIPIWIYNNIQEKFKTSINVDSSNEIENIIEHDKLNIKRNNNLNEEIEIYSDEIHKNIKTNELIKTTNSLDKTMLPFCSYNTFQKWNMLDKTFIWLNNKYENNTNMENEKIDLLKIDPKVNFAAERTFLHYTLLSIYINLLALYLMNCKNVNNDHLATILLILFAASYFSLISSYIIYLYRISIIQRRMTREVVKNRSRFDSIYNPMLFLFLILLAIILSFQFNYKLKTKQIT